MNDRKPIPRESRAFYERIDNCKDCGLSLKHDFYTKDELVEKGINLGKNQRISFCDKCEILYINSK